jgi:hypothetical protein
MAPSVVCDAPTVRVRKAHSRRRQPQSRPYFSAPGRNTIEGPAPIVRRFGLSISQTRQTTAPVAGPLLERDSELATLAAMVEAARVGEGQLVAIEGSAGIGKTRLLAEVRTAAAEAGLDVLAARAGELEREFAFGVVRQLFEPLLARSSEEERGELLSGAAGLAAPLFDEAQLRLGDGASSDASFSTLHGLYWLAANIALRRPLVVAVDDLHWADAASLRWLGYLARRLEGLPLVLVVATRPRPEGEESPMLDELLGDPAAVVVRPGPLGTTAVSALVRHVLAAEPEEAFVAAAETASGGNPLFLRALLDAVAREQLAPTAANATSVLELGPEAVPRAVSVRLSRLPEPAHASACGRSRRPGDDGGLKRSSCARALRPAAPREPGRVHAPDRSHCRLRGDGRRRPHARAAPSR